MPPLGNGLFFPDLGWVMQMQHSKAPNNILYGLIWLRASDCSLLMGYRCWSACSLFTDSQHACPWEGNCQKEQFSDWGQLPGLRCYPVGVSVDLGGFCGSQVLRFLCGAAGKKYQPSTLCSSAIYSDANLWSRWLMAWRVDKVHGHPAKSYALRTPLKRT